MGHTHTHPPTLNAQRGMSASDVGHPLESHSFSCQKGYRDVGNMLHSILNAQMQEP
jgi:hypothetical protein